MKRLLTNTVFILVMAIALGCVAGLECRQMSADVAVPVCKTLMAVKVISSRAIFFLVPLIIFGCMAPAMARLNGRASGMLGFAMLIAYLSSVTAAFFSLGISRFVIPGLDFGVQQQLTGLPANPLADFVLPTVHPVWALIAAISTGLVIGRTRSECAVAKLEKFQKAVLTLMRKAMKPLLPSFIGSNFALIAYTGQIFNMGVFLPILALIVVCQLVWIVALYAFATTYTGKSGWRMLGAYTKAYFTALGTMSSIITLPVSMECMSRSRLVDKDTYSFTLPLFSNSNLCGSVIAEIVLVAATYYVFYGMFPPVFNLVTFTVVACILSIGSPGVPGGLNVACSTILGALILNGGEIDTFTGLLATLYTLQDGFGTACNVVTSGALTLITEKKMPKHVATGALAPEPAAQLPLAS